MDQGSADHKPLVPIGPFRPSSVPILSYGTSATGPPVSGPQSRKRKPKAPNKAEAEWARVKDHFKQLYIIEDKSLDEVRQVLEKEKDFQATTDQFTTMVRKWKLKKTISKREYQHLLRIDERQSSGPSKRKRFTLGDRNVKRAKIERFKIDHPNLGPRRSPTPSIIDYETERFSEITDTLSQLRLGDQDGQGRSLMDEPPDPIDSEASIIDLHVPIDPVQREENLLTNIAIIYGESEEETPGRMDHGVAETEAAVHTVEAEAHETDSCSGRHAEALGTTTRSSRRRRKARPQVSETRRPGAHSPSLSDFDWWEMFGRWSSSRSFPLYAINDEDIKLNYDIAEHLEHNFSVLNRSFHLDKLFPGLVIERNTYADEMNHREQVHQHYMLAVEADICRSTPLDLDWDRNMFLSLDMIRYRNEFGPKTTVSTRWCVSEGLRGVVLDLMTIPDWSITLGFLDQISLVISESDKNNMFDSILGFATLVLSCLNVTRDPQYPDYSWKSWSFGEDGLWKLRQLNLFLEYFDPYRPPTAFEEEQSLQATDRTRFNIQYLERYKDSIPGNAFQIITAVRSVQQDSHYQSIFESTVTSIPSLRKEAYSSDGSEATTWFALWCLANSLHGLPRRDTKVSCQEPYASQPLGQTSRALRRAKRRLVQLWINLMGDQVAVLQSLNRYSCGKGDIGPTLPAEADHGSSLRNESTTSSNKFVARMSRIRQAFTCEESSSSKGKEIESSPDKETRNSMDGIFAYMRVKTMNKMMQNLAALRASSSEVDAVDRPEESLNERPEASASDEIKAFSAEEFNASTDKIQAPVEAVKELEELIQTLTAVRILQVEMQGKHRHHKQSEAPTDEELESSVSNGSGTPTNN